MSLDVQPASERKTSKPASSFIPLSSSSVSARNIWWEQLFWKYDIVNIYSLFTIIYLQNQNPSFEGVNECLPHIHIHQPERSGAIFIIVGNTTQENVQQHVKIGPT